MARIRKSLNDIKASPPKIDRALMRATKPADIRRQQIEDGEDPDGALPEFASNLVRAARSRLAMSQSEMAALTRIPLATIRNWEQGRTKPDAAASALFKILSTSPQHGARILKRA